MAYVLWRVLMKKYSKVRLGIRNFPVSDVHALLYFYVYVYNVYLRLSLFSSLVYGVVAEAF